MKSLAIFGLILLALVKPYPSYSQNQNNINKPVYDINDPRNPDCPCHKLQALAEREYKQEQQISSLVTGTTSSTLSNSSVGSSKTSGFKKFQRIIKKKLAKNTRNWFRQGKQGLYPLRKGKFLICRKRHTEYHFA